jgi:hypothetical protein
MHERLRPISQLFLPISKPKIVWGSEAGRVGFSIEKVVQLIQWLFHKTEKIHPKKEKRPIFFYLCRLIILQTTLKP